MPVLVRVTVCPALVVPTSCGEKVRLEGETEAVGDGATPVPETLELCGLPEALSITDKTALLAPVAVGENCI